MRCIYCLENSVGTKGQAHVVAEGVSANALTLPKGTICDDCNNYFGHELESVLVAHPIISLAIQTFHLGGKAGKRRKRIGNVDRTIHEGSITIPCEPPSFTTVDGIRMATFRPLMDGSFDFQRFRRALHHIALNLIAYQDGPDRALDTSYDAIRRYVRCPLKGESWPFVQKLWPLLDTDRDVKLGLNLVNGTEVAAMKILCSAFFVALIDPTVLRILVDKDPTLGLDYVIADYRPPKSQTLGMKRYRFSINVDE